MLLRDPFQGVSNRADWSGGIKMTDATDDSLINLTGATATMTLRDQGGTETIIASTSAGTLAFPEVGYVVFEISKETMRNLAPGTYAAGLLAEREDVTLQAFLTNVPIVEGL